MGSASLAQGWGGERAGNAYENARADRIVIVSTKQTEAIEAGADGSKVEKTSRVRRDWYVKVSMSMGLATGFDLRGID
ncbi:hypothetical protein CBM2606_A60009 [Cupriavidus taiwanensis]|nr:hypothetical protein CBM2606_A60009 [Cupriavidus taiwanensis]